MYVSEYNLFTPNNDECICEMGTKYDNQKIKEKMDNTKSKGKRIDSPTATSDDISNIFYKHYPKYQKGELDES